MIQAVSYQEDCQLLSWASRAREIQYKEQADQGKEGKSYWNLRRSRLKLNHKVLIRYRVVKCIDTSIYFAIISK
jgi:hypothetical protein